MSCLKIIGYPFALLYGLVLAIRNVCFDYGIFKVTRFPISVISVGNLSVGGTGKTPHVAYLVDYLMKSFHTAIVLRGYGRKTKGVLAVDASKSSEDVGDEARSYYADFKEQVPVFVAASRVEGVDHLLKQFPSTDVVVLDDAFQHRHIHRDVNVLLMDYNRPYWKDAVLPAGKLREFACGKKRADVLLVTKTPDDITSNQKDWVKNKISKNFSKPIFFSRIKYGDLVPFYENAVSFKEVKQVILVTGIENPTPLVQHLKKKYEVKHVKFKDHYDFTTQDIQKIHDLFDTFVKNEKIIITTFKDFMRLNNTVFKELLVTYPWFYQSIQVDIEEEETFNAFINNHVRKN